MKTIAILKDIGMGIAWAWKWLSGKKSTIGTILLIAGAILEQVVASIWGIRTEFLYKLIETLDWVGMVLGGVGLAHKAVKRVRESKEIGVSASGTVLPLALLLLLSSTAQAQRTDQLRFSSIDQVSMSERPQYDSSKTYISQLIPLGAADTVWGDFLVGDTVDVDLYIRHVRFEGTLLRSDTTALLDTLAAGLGGGAIKISHVVSPYRSWLGYQWILQFRSFSIATVSNTKSDRYFMGRGLTK